MIKTVLQARQLLDSVGWPYKVEVLGEGEQARARELLKVPDGVGSILCVMFPVPINKAGKVVVVFDGDGNYAGTYSARGDKFIPAASRSRFYDFERHFS